MRFAAALVALLAAASAARGGTACPSAGAQPDAIASVGPRLELHLADGRTLRLVGLDPAGPTPGDPDRAETSRAALTGMIAGKSISANLLSDKPDRWGRLPAMVFRDGDPEPGGWHAWRSTAASPATCRARRPALPRGPADGGVEGSFGEPWPVE